MSVKPAHAAQQKQAAIGEGLSRTASLTQQAKQTENVMTSVELHPRYWPNMKAEQEELVTQPIPSMQLTDKASGGNEQDNWR